MSPKEREWPKERVAKGEREAKGEGVRPRERECGQGKERVA